MQSSLAIVIAAFAFIVPTPIVLNGARVASKEKVIHSFKGTDGFGPYANLVSDSAGNLYGTTDQGGAYSLGTVFELIPGANGKWTEKVLHSFGNGQDGYNPVASVIFDAAGNLFGTTALGGGTGCGPLNMGCGTVFQLTPGADDKWTEKVLHRFNGLDGQYPEAGLSLDAGGNLYGTTVVGGTGSGCGQGCGNVFELTPGAKGKWHEKVLHNFSGTEGYQPWAGVILDHAGNLYGTTSAGGINGGGTVFELISRPDGKWHEKVLHNFGVADGMLPYAGLISDATGNLYGTTFGGGTSTQCTLGCGTVFELMPETHGNWHEKVLHSFGNGKDGVDPERGSLVLDAAGHLYGTTKYGGAYIYYGTVFELIPQANGKWVEQVLHNFDNNGKDGYAPYGGVILDSAGNLYGTTRDGGNGCPVGCGIVFEVSP